MPTDPTTPDLIQLAKNVLKAHEDGGLMGMSLPSQVALAQLVLDQKKELDELKQRLVSPAEPKCAVCGHDAWKHYSGSCEGCDCPYYLRVKVMNPQRALFYMDEKMQGKQP